MDKHESLEKENIDSLKTRVAFLERENQWYFSALELATSLDDLYRRVRQQEDPEDLVREMRSLIRRILPLDLLALYLVGHEEANFVLKGCQPAEARDRVEHRTESWIEEGAFAWALQQTRPVQLEGPGKEDRWFLHPLATRSTTLGMIVGRLPSGHPPLRAEQCKVLSIIFQNIAQAMENARLYHEMQNQNCDLEKLVQSRTQDLKNKTEELERRMEEIQDFTYMASHDLQEPVRKFMVFGDRLKHLIPNQSDPRGQEYLAAMDRAAVRMNSLVNGLLNLSRVTTQGRPLQITNLNSVLQSALQGLGFELEDSGAELERDSLPTLPADPMQVHQVFTHLIGNALKFQPPGQTPKICITTRHLPTDGWEIVVTDNGIGIDPKHHERIFKPFERLHRHEDYPGAGIGLSICRKIMERHGGNIQVESRPGEGARFILLFPAL